MGAQPSARPGEKFPYAGSHHHQRANIPSNSFRTIELTVVIAADGQDDETAYEAVRDYIEAIELRIGKGTRAFVFKGETRRPTKAEITSANEDPTFTEKPFDAHD